MDANRVRVRFAPSPTGALHVGSARTALFNWLFARHHGGAFILRIEDTDATRSTEESTRTILEGLRWLGIDWDEGPEVGGPYGPYFQSERLEHYQRFADELVKRGYAYPCYCTPEEVNQRRQAMREAGLDPKYDRRCRGLSAEERRRLEAEGRRPVLRFFSSDEGETVVCDIVRGEMRFANEVLDDFVIMRSDGLPTYNFAVVVDDHLMGITHVIRGDDHISNTPRQVQVYEALGLPVPRFAHLPMILGPDRTKLSKRHGAQSVVEFAEAGYLPEAVVNYLALLGWAYDDSQEIFSIPDELIEKFTLEKVSKHAAIFDHQKFEWMNGVYIRSLTPAELARRALPRLQEAGFVSPSPSAAELARVEGIMAAVQPRVKTLNEIVPATRYFFTDDFAYDEAAVSKWLRRDYVPELFRRLSEELAALEPFDEKGIEEVLNRLAGALGISRGNLMQPIRVAVTGGTVSPGMYETLALLGKQTTRARLERALAQLSAST